jgi:leader peptidase (prepilin peptidase)/N-methyltransferase
LSPALDGPAAWVAGGAALLLAAAAAGFAPRRLLARVGEDRDSWTQGPRLAGLALAGGTLVYAVVGLILGGGFALALALAAASLVLIAVLIIDARHQLIPDLYVLALLALAIVGPLATPPRDLILGALALGGLSGLIRWAFLRLRKIEGLGLGDVKLLAAIGALVGPEPGLWVLVSGALIGVGWGWARHRGPIREAPAVPLGACLALPALLAVILVKAPA